MKRLSISLCLLLLLTAASSCGDAGQPVSEKADETQPAAESSVVTETDERALYADIAPAVEDFGGYNYRMLSQNNLHNDKYALFGAEAETGDTMNDAVYARNLAVEEAYNVDVTFIEMPDTNESVKKLILAGEDYCDAQFTYYGRDLVGMIEAGYLYDLSEFSELTLTAPWWDERSNNTRLAGRLFTLAGDISYFDELTEMCVSYNKMMYNELDFENPYALVTEGRWTLDKLQTMAAAAGKDLNGDGKMTYADQWGLTTEISAAWYFYLGSGESSVVVRNDGYTLTFGDDKFYQVFDKVFDLMLASDYVFPVDNGKFADEITTDNCYTQASLAMQEDRVLFHTGCFVDTLALRDMKTDFGILPIPKFDEAQEGYYNMVSYMSRPLSIPVTVTDTHRTALLTDALSYESMFTLTPKFYSEFLGEKILRDQESLEMVDILFDSMVFDIDFWFDITGLPSKVSEMVRNGKYTLASSAASLTKAADKKISGILDAVKNLD